jgi:hypothetical protein
MPPSGTNIPSPFSRPQYAYAPPAGSYEHPADPMTVEGEERNLVIAVWSELTTADPDIVASLYHESPRLTKLLSFA